MLLFEAILQCTPALRGQGVAVAVTCGLDTSVSQSFAMLT